MTSPISDIELQLRRAHFWNSVNDARKKLNQDFALLDEADADKLLARILFRKRSDTLAQPFRDLHRAIRLELLLILAARLGHLKSERYYELLTKTSGLTTEEKERQEGLRNVFPDHMKGMRDKFLQALRDQFSPFHTRPAGPDPKVPGVMLEFRNSGSFSYDNKAKLITTVPVRRLGPDWNTGHNYMEIRGDVIGHRAGAEYQFHRTIERGAWYRLGKNVWRRWGAEYLPPGTDDDTNDADESLFPDHNHIYVFDGPGLEIIGPPEPNVRADPQYKEITDAIRDDSLTAYVWIMNALEWVEIKPSSGAPWIRGEELEWHTVTWLDKPEGGSWRRTPGLNWIEKGSIPNLKGAEPPVQ
jgi:hypothetical protein